MWWVPSSSHISEVSPSASHTLEWMWQLEPTLSKAYLAMKVIACPLRAAISLTPFL